MALMVDLLNGSLAPVVQLWSGGKDSAMALWTARQTGETGSSNPKIGSSRRC